MRISTKRRYGMRIMLELALRYGEGPIAVERIAKAQGLGSSYIHSIARSLRDADLIRAVRGPTGGYELARPPSDITALQIITALQGMPLVPCVNADSPCEKMADCLMRDLWREAWEAMQGVLASYSLQDLVHKQSEHCKGLKVG
ncbi:MAG: RrF2 family transcriptional regulator [Myxococcota bacterium]